MTPTEEEILFVAGISFDLDYFQIENIQKAFVERDLRDMSFEDLIWSLIEEEVNE